jgi:hypothetical protein
MYHQVRLLWPVLVSCLTIRGHEKSITSLIIIANEADLQIDVTKKWI